MTKFPWEHRIKEALLTEAQSLIHLSHNLPACLEEVLDSIRHCQGKLVCAGVGKSSFVARKVSASLSSVGVPSFFLDATQAAHGDLGTLSAQDQVLAFSYTGKTQELLPVFTHARKLGLSIFLITAFPQSFLGELATLVLNIPEVQEVGPLSAVPSTSSIVMMAMGDILTIVLGDACAKEDYLAFHPKGFLGYRFSPVSQVMHQSAALPLVHHDTPMSETLVVMTEKRKGCTGVIDSQGKLQGVISDGDLRRNLTMKNFLSCPARDIMTPTPKVIPQDMLVYQAIDVMKRYKITFLFVVDDHQKPIGLFHIHDDLASGLSPSS